MARSARWYSSSGLHVNGLRPAPFILVAGPRRAGVKIPEWSVVLIALLQKPLMFGFVTCFCVGGCQLEAVVHETAIKAVCLLDLGNVLCAAASQNARIVVLLITRELCGVVFGAAGFQRTAGFTHGDEGLVAILPAAISVAHGVTAGASEQRCHDYCTQGAEPQHPTSCSGFTVGWNFFILEFHCVHLSRFQVALCQLSTRDNVRAPRVRYRSVPRAPTRVSNG